MGLRTTSPQTTFPFNITLSFWTGFLLGLVAVGFGLPHLVNQDIASHSRYADVVIAVSCISLVVRQSHFHKEILVSSFSTSFYFFSPFLLAAGSTT